MTSVFSKVQADVASEFVGKFPEQFDFLGMLQRVSEEVGVSVKKNLKMKFTLEGQWSPIGRVHDILASTLAVYGATGILREDNYNVKEEPNVSLTSESTHPRVSPSQSEIGLIIENSENNSSRRPSLVRSATRQPIIESIESEDSGDDDDTVNENDEENDYDNGEYCKLKTKISDICSSLNTEEEDQERVLKKVKDEDDVNDHKKDSEHEEIVENEKQTKKCNKSVTKDAKKGTGKICNKTEKEKPLQKTRSRLRKETKLSTIMPRLKPKMISIKFDTNGQKFHKKFIPGYRLKSKKKVSDDDYSDSEEQTLKKKRGRPKKDPSDVQQEFPCKQCDFVGRNRNSLGDHCHRVHFASPTKCDICDKVFPNVRYMRRHRASHVSPQHVCDVCGKMYKVLKALRNHRQTHEDGYTKPEFSCSQCSKSYCSQFILDCHVKAEHEGQKRKFLCSTCGKSFTTKHTLVQHYNVHSGARPYMCEECGKGFRYESALRDHKFTHSQVRNFECSVCLKKFRQRSAMKMHEKIHKEKKDFTCAECGRGFTQKQALQRHVRAHKGFKPFVCKICGRGFGDSSIIRRHMICVHRINKDIKTWREDIVARGKQDEEEFQNESTVERDHSYVQATGDGDSDSVPEEPEITGRKEQEYPAMQIENTIVMNLSDDYKRRELSMQNLSMNDVVAASSSVCDSPTSSVSGTSAPHAHSLALTPHQQNLDIPPPPPSHMHQSSEELGASLYSVESAQPQTLSYDDSHNLQGQHHEDVSRYPAYAITGSLAHQNTQNIPASLPDHSYHETSSTETNQQPSLPRVDSVLSKRLNEMEPPDNLSISSLYAYYTNLASQYINASQYPGYIPTAENSSSSQEQ